jgi:hypothetical protein
MAKRKAPLEQSLREVRRPFFGEQGRDFSAADILNASSDGQNFFESIFNGCTFDGFHARQCIFQHAEFTEARFTGCVFEDTSFDHSDFVVAELSDSTFIRCSFQNAEWRDSLLQNVRFQQCIFRNTTTSLAHFSGCYFDDASAVSFVGPSKRYSIFCKTRFPLGSGQLAFLRTNFGVTSETSGHALETDTQDPLFAMAVDYYYGVASSARFYGSVCRAFAQLSTQTTRSYPLKLRYVFDICKFYVHGNLLSIFAIQYLETTLSRKATELASRDQGIQLLSLIIDLRVSLRERILRVEDELSEIPPVESAGIRISMHFERSFSRAEFDQYVHGLATYCGLTEAGLSITRFANGSTFADIVISGSTMLTDVLRYLRYSLSLATITLAHTMKLRKLLLSCPNRAKPQALITKRSPSAKAVRKRKLDARSAAVTSEIIGARPKGIRPIEIFVDKANEQVLIIDGNVKVTVSIK